MFKDLFGLPSFNMMEWAPSTTWNLGGFPSVITASVVSWELWNKEIARVFKK
jgi:hypothetical protein